MFKKHDFIEAINKAKEISLKRKFEQSIDLTINFRGIDFKKGANQIDLNVELPNATGKIGNVKSLVFVHDKKFAEELKGKASKIILDSDIPNLKKKEVEILIKDYDLFLAEGPAMLIVAKNLGQQLAPKGKMPKLIPANINQFDSMVAKLATSVKVTTKKGKFMPLIHVLIGKESMDSSKIAENAEIVFNSVFNAIKKSPQNIKSVQVKLTMGPVVKIGKINEAVSQIKGDSQ
jgi:large subunit ribosomal protein L1